jgi:RHS repeat-associated protein
LGYQPEFRTFFDTVTFYFHNDATTIYTYSIRGRQSNVINPDGSFIRSYYDAQGNRTAEVTPFDSVAYGYDVLNRMQTVTASTGTTHYFFDAVGNRDSVLNANGIATGYHYDNLNRLVNVTNWGAGNTVISSYTYDLNKAGIRTAVDEADGSHVGYGYDASYRLINEVRIGAHPYSISYVYDNVGNRLSKTKDGQSTSYVYNNRDQLMSETGSSGLTTYTYDHAGRMATKTDVSGTVSYSWIDNDRMASVSGPDVLATYDYDAAGQRVSETTASGTKKYLIDYQLPYGQVLAEMDGSGNLVVDYVYGLDRISMTRGASTHTYSTDGQGSIRQLTNAAGMVLNEYFYTGFGEELAKTETTFNDFRYVGEQWDANVGWYYNRARWMDPSTGRFTSVDPYDGYAEAPVSLRKYLYANVNPISLRDPSGTISIDECLTAIAISGILAANTIPAYPIGRTGNPNENNFVVFQKEGTTTSMDAASGSLYWVSAPWHSSYGVSLRFFMQSKNSSCEISRYDAYSGGRDQEGGVLHKPISSNYPSGNDYFVKMNIVNKAFTGLPEEGVQRITTSSGAVIDPGWGTIRAKIDGVPGGNYYFHDPADNIPSTHGCIGTDQSFMSRLYNYATSAKGVLHVIVATGATGLKAKW